MKDLDPREKEKEKYCPKEKVMDAWVMEKSDEQNVPVMDLMTFFYKYEVVMGALGMVQGKLMKVCKGPVVALTTTKKKKKKIGMGIPKAKGQVIRAVVLTMTMTTKRMWMEMWVVC